VGTDPDNLDTDNDGVNDELEVNTLGTNPLFADDDIDNDGDGFTNAEEVLCDSNPVDSSSRCGRALPFLMLLLD